MELKKALIIGEAATGIVGFGMIAITVGIWGAIGVFLVAWSSNIHSRIRSM